MSGEELKPCGHCGAAARVSLSIQSDPPLYAVGCSECIIMTEWDADEAVVAAAWNRRNPLPEQPQEGWRTMDSAPKDRCILLASLAVANAGQGPEWAITAGYWDAEFEWDNDEHRGAWTDDTVASWGYQERVELSPSRWMPLPTPPSTETKESGE